MKKIEIKKGENVFTFKEPFANDLIEYQIANGELQEQLLECFEKTKPFLGKDQKELSKDEVIEVARINGKSNLLIAKRDKLSYDYTVKHLIDVKSKDYTLEEIKAFQVSISSIKDVLEAFTESLTKEDLGK